MFHILEHTCTVWARFKLVGIFAYLSGEMLFCMTIQYFANGPSNPLYLLAFSGAFVFGRQSKQCALIYRTSRMDLRSLQSHELIDPALAMMKYMWIPPPPSNSSRGLVPAQKILCQTDPPIPQIAKCIPVPSNPIGDDQHSIRQQSAQNLSYMAPYLICLLVGREIITTLLCHLFPR